MKTAMQLAVETIEGLPASMLTAQDFKDVVVGFLKDGPIYAEKEQLITAYTDGQSHPLVIHMDWFNRKYGQIERAGDE